MNPPRASTRELFDRAVVVGPAERRLLLEQARAADPDACREVESLLAYHDQRSALLDRPAVEGATVVISKDAKDTGNSISGLDESASHHQSRAPERIGTYAVLGTIGTGGMGVVYEARQESPRRTVALKVITPGALSPGLLKRFGQEAAALARLQHPGIAQVYEAGVDVHSERPRPFIAMELVRGQPLTDYATSRALSTRDRLELFAKVCDAVEHAHRRSVVHRDLKPANILVTPEGQPKILDFGVARLTDADAKVTTLATHLGQIIGTLAYMSPEQAAGNPAAVDARSDVYALGVILYELLSGSLPVDPGDAAVHEALRRISRDEPRSLSSHDKRLRGDLDTIARRALEKDKTRRYQSAEGLGDDVRRFLADQPIAARRPSALYQFVKFSRRNRALVGGVAAVFLALLAGLTTTMVQASRARAEARRAQDAYKTMTDVHAFFARMFDAVDPANSPGGPVTVKELLDSASQRLSSSFSDRPEVSALIHRTLATAYLSLGEFRDSEAHARSAHQSFGQVVGHRHRDTLEAAGLVGQALYEQNRSGEVIDLLRESYATAQEALGADDRTTLVLRTALAIASEAVGDFDTAERLYIADLTAVERRAGLGDPGAIVARSNLGIFLMDRGKHEAAEEHLTRAVRDARTTLPPDNPETITAVMNLGALYSRMNRLDEAEPVMREARDASARVYGPDHVNTLHCAGNLGTLLSDMGRFEEAEEVLIPVLERCRAALGGSDLRTLDTLHFVAALRFKQERFAEAEALALESYERSAGLLGPAHERTINAASLAAQIYEGWEKPDLAAEWAAKATTGAD